MSLRPFFSYYGGKWRVAKKHYPEPQHDMIVEPFAGSAGYALRYPDRQVILVERDPVVAAVWRYLKTVSEHEFLSLPLSFSSVDELSVCQEAKWLIGFWLNRGVSRPRKSPSRWMREGLRPGSFWGEEVRNRLAFQLHAIRHWMIIEGDYTRAPHVEATWFVDPPYQLAGKHYHHGSKDLDFEKLGQWCQAQRGQVLVCENEGADWLPFQPLADIRTARRSRRSREVLWQNNPAS